MTEGPYYILCSSNGTLLEDNNYALRFRTVEEAQRYLQDNFKVLPIGKVQYLMDRIDICHDLRWFHNEETKELESKE